VKGGGNHPYSGCNVRIIAGMGWEDYWSEGQRRMIEIVVALVTLMTFFTHYVGPCRTSWAAEPHEWTSVESPSR
jgi:hypothetical protein